MFDFYRDYKLQYIAGDYILISDWFGKDNSLCCANLQDAKNQIDRRLRDYNIADTNVCQENQEKEQKMFDECNTLCAAPVRIKGNYSSASVVTAIPVEATQRDYAIERIKAIGEKHAHALLVRFNMDPKIPRTWNELKALIDAGDFTVDKEKVDSDFADHYSIFYGVTFGKPADKAGYEAARGVLKAAAQKALDKATLGTLDALEGVIDDFEAWTL